MKKYCQNLKDITRMYRFGATCYVLSAQGVWCLNQCLLIILVLFSSSS